jgi:hypothetical protein
MQTSFGCKPDQFAPQTRSTLGVGGLDWACKRGRSLAWKKKKIKKGKRLKELGNGLKIENILSHHNKKV